MKSATTKGLNLAVTSPASSPSAAKEDKKEDRATIEIPEPSVAAVLAAGTGLLVGMNYWRRRRTFLS